MTNNIITAALIQIPGFLFAVCVHEAAHAWVADKCGDPTAKNMGRITLNPVPHVDPIGTILMPILMMITSVPLLGWAKPVMVNPLNFRNYKRDDILVSIAGPASNLLSALVGVALYHILWWAFVSGVAQFGFMVTILKMLEYFVLINFVLMAFNMIPIPPLDGSHVLEKFLRGEALETWHRIQPYGFVILIVLLYTGIFGYIIRPFIYIAYKMLGR